MWGLILGFGVGAVAYGIRGERVPGKIISLSDTSDNGLRPAERIFWVFAEIAAIALGLYLLRFRLRGS